MQVVGREDDGRLWQYEKDPRDEEPGISLVQDAIRRRAILYRYWTKATCEALCVL